MSVQPFRYVTRADDRSVVMRRAAVPPSRHDHAGGLVVGMVDAPVRVLTGVVMGPVQVSVVSSPTRPTTVLADWEDVVELSVCSDGGPVVIAGPYDADPPILARLDFAGSGMYRIRVHARHRDVGFDGVAVEPREHYQVVSWLAPARPAEVLAVGSRVAVSLQRSLEASATMRRSPVVGPPLDGERQAEIESRIAARVRSLGRPVDGSA